MTQILSYKVNSYTCYGSQVSSKRVFHHVKAHVTKDGMHFSRYFNKLHANIELKF